MIYLHLPQFSAVILSNGCSRNPSATPSWRQWRRSRATAGRSRRLDRGDLPADVEEALEHIDQWAEAGITHVVDNRIEYSDEKLVALVDPSIGYFHNGADAAGQRMPDVWFDRGVDFTVAAFSGDPAAGVLLHCHMGINRGPSAAYAVLLRLGWDPIEAIDLIRTKRPIAAVGYAEDALDWWHRRSGATREKKVDDVQRLARWRRRHPHDTVRIIRSIREGGSAA